MPPVVLSVQDQGTRPPHLAGHDFLLPWGIANEDARLARVAVAGAVVFRRHQGAEETDLFARWREVAVAHSAMLAEAFKIASRMDLPDEFGRKGGRGGARPLFSTSSNEGSLRLTDELKQRLAEGGGLTLGQT